MSRYTTLRQPPLGLLFQASPLLAMILYVGCGGSSSEPQSPAVGTSTQVVPPASPSAPSQGEPVAQTAPAGAEPAQAAQGPGRLRYDFARHLDRAQFKVGDAWVVDGGEAAFHQFTLGGWRSHFTRNARDGETTVAVMEGVIGILHIPRVTQGDLVLTLRARALRDGRVTFYIGDQTVGYGEFDVHEYRSISVRIAADKLRDGENVLQMRVPGTAAFGHSSNAGLLIDWFALGPEEVREPTFATLDASGALVLAAGTSLTFPFEAMGGDVLVAQSSAGAAMLSQSSDGIASSEIGHADATERRFTLSAPIGSVTNLRVSASEPVALRMRLEGPAMQVAPAPTGIRNVIVYLTDTLRADKLTPYRASTRVQTPGLNRFAELASVMLQGHGQENWTKPSVATLLSGLFPWEHNATTEAAQVPSSVNLVSERLRGDGFTTAAFIANGFCSDRFGFQQGFDTFRNYIREGRRSQAQFVAADVLNWLDHRPEDRPFFLYVHTIDPHVPYLPPEETLMLYDHEPYAGIVNFNRDRELLEKVKSGQIQLNSRDRERLAALYDAEITYHDIHFGSIMEGLERRGLRDNTMVVFTADHGEEFFDHGSVGHGHSMYEELIHVPLIVYVPGLARGARVGDVVGLVDVLPTIFEALGKPRPEGLSGESFLPLLRGAEQDAPRYAVSGFMEGWRSVVVGSYKLIHRTDRRFMVYNISTDPGETRDLAPTSPALVRYLRGLLGLGLARAQVASPTATTRTVRREETQIDSTLRQQLEALGYAGASRPGEVPRPRTQR